VHFAFNFSLKKIIVGFFSYNLGQRKWIFFAYNLGRREYIYKKNGQPNI